MEAKVEVQQKEHHFGSMEAEAGAILSYFLWKFSSHLEAEVEVI